MCRNRPPFPPWLLQPPQRRFSHPVFIFYPFTFASSISTKKSQIFFFDRPRIFNVAFIFPSAYYISMAPATPSVKSKIIKTCRKKISAREKVRITYENGFNDDVIYIDDKVVHQGLKE